MFEVTLSKSCPLPPILKNNYKYLSVNVTKRFSRACRWTYQCFLVTVPVVSSSVTKNSLSLRILHFYLGVRFAASLGVPGPPCSPFSIHLGCFGFPWYPFGVSSVLFGALFSFSGCPLTALRSLWVTLVCLWDPSCFSLMCIESHLIDTSLRSG